VGAAGTIAKAILGTRHFIWEMDVYPDLLVTLGALGERGLVTRILSGIENCAGAARMGLSPSVHACGRVCWQVEHPLI
jgi:hypothetical protein